MGTLTMDILTFIARLVEFLAWPAAVIITVLILRKDIQRLLLLVKRLKAGPIEAEFEREVKQLAQGVAPVSSQPAEYAALTDRKIELMRIAETSPRSAILEAWRDIEIATVRLVERKGISVPESQRNSSTAAIRTIAKGEQLTPEWVGRYYELRELRNKAAHETEFNPTIESAAAYIEITSRLRARIEAAGKNTAPPPK